MKQKKHLKTIKKSDLYELEEKLFNKVIKKSK